MLKCGIQFKIFSTANNKLNIKIMFSISNFHKIAKAVTFGRLITCVHRYNKDDICSTVLLLTE